MGLSKASHHSLEDMMHIPMFSLAISTSGPHSASSLFLTCSALLIVCLLSPLQLTKAISRWQGALTASGLGSPEGSALHHLPGAGPQYMEHVHLHIPLQQTNISRGEEGGIRSCTEVVTNRPAQAGAPSAHKYLADAVKSGPAMPHAQESMAGEHPPRSTSEGLCLCHT